MSFGAPAIGWHIPPCSTREPLTLGACSRLEVGQVLELPGTESGQLSLYAETMNGNVAISQGELGVWKGHRALKLSEPLLDSFIKEIAGI